MSSHNRDPNEPKLNLLQVIAMQDLSPAERAEEADARDAAVKRAFKYCAALLIVAGLVGAANDSDKAPTTEPKPAVEAPAPLHGEIGSDGQSETSETVADGTPAPAAGGVMRTGQEQGIDFSGDPMTAILHSVISTLR